MPKDKDDTDVKALLQAMVDRAGQPPPLDKRVRRHVRLRQSLFAAGIVAVVAPLAGVAAWSTRSEPRAADRTSVAAQDAGSHRVFVLDSEAPGARSNSVVWSARVTDGRVSDVRRIDLPVDADVDLSPDGTLLYSVGHDVYAKDPRDVLSVIESRTGQIVDEETVPAWQGSTGFHLTDKIAASPDSKAVYVLVGFPADPLAPPQALATYDTVSGSILQEQVPLDRCGGSPTLLPLVGSRVVVVCPQVRTVEFIDVGPAGAPATRSDIGVPLEDIAAAGASEDGSRVYVVSRLGDVVVIDTARQEIIERAKISLPEDRVVGIRRLALMPPDYDRMLLGLDHVENLNAGVGDIIASVSTSDWSNVQTVPAGVFSWFTLSSDGNVGFTINTQTARVAAFDARGRRGPTPLEGLGTRPVNVEVAPPE